MKKIIFGLLIAFVALSFMGCPTVYKDLDFEPLPVGDAVGDMNGDGMLLTPTAPGKYKTASFTYSNDMKAWGGGDGVCSFKIRVIPGDWGASYGYETAKAGSLPSGVTLGESGGNIQLKGLVDGKVYHFEFAVTSKDITVNLIEE